MRDKNLKNTQFIVFQSINAILLDIKQIIRKS